MNKEFELDAILEEVEAKKVAKANVEKQEVKETPVVEPVKEETKVELQRETIGTKQEGVKEATEANKKSKKGKIATAIGAIAAAGLIIITVKGCSKGEEKQEAEVTTTSITVETPVEETEKEIIEIELTDEDFIEETTVTTKEFITTAPKTEETIDTTVAAPIEETTEEIKPIINADDIVVTKAKEEKTTPVETTVTKEETKPVETTAAPVETTTVKTEKVMEVTTKEEKEEPIEIIPIKIKNLDEKVNILKDTALLSGYLLTDELATDTIRVLHSDYIEHDEFKEITAQKYNDVLTVLTNIGSMNENLLNMSYITGQLSLSGKFYLPAAIFPENIQSYVKEYNKLTDEYVKALNDNQYIPGEIDYEEIQNSSLEEQQRRLDEYNQIMTDNEQSIGIQNFDEYLDLLEKAVNNQISDEAEKIRLAELENQTKLQKEREKAYSKYINQVQELINKPEYKEMASAQLSILVNVTPVLLSGVDTNNYDRVANKVQTINDSISTSVDDIRETLIKANRINNKKNKGKTIDQNQVLKAYVEEATIRNEEQSKVFSTIIDDIKDQAASYVKTR